jgi:hypothetical protein
MPEPLPTEPTPESVPPETPPSETGTAPLSVEFVQGENPPADKNPLADSAPESEVAATGSPAETPDAGLAVALHELGSDENSAEPALEAIPPRDFEDLTLAELVGQFVRAPFRTWARLSPVLNDEMRQVDDLSFTLPAGEALPPPTAVATDVLPNRTLAAVALLRDWVGDRVVLQLGLYLIAVLLAWFGALLFVRIEASIGRSEGVQLAAGLPYVLFGMIVWLAAEWVGSTTTPLRWWRDLSTAAKYQAALRAIPVVLILLGVWWLADASDERVDPETIDRIVAMSLNGIALIVGGILLWVGLDFGQWRGQSAQKIPVEQELTESTSVPTAATSRSMVEWFMAISPLRGILVVIAAYLSLMTWFGTTRNNLPTNVFYLWLSSIFWWWAVFAPLAWMFEFVPRRALALFGGIVLSLVVWLGLIPTEVAIFNLAAWLVGTGLCWWAIAPDTVSFDLPERVARWLTFRWTTAHVIVAALVIAILVVGSAFRLSRLNGSPADNTAVPPEMTSDHVEKLLDSQRVLDGDRDIFFANNGGREPIQMYVMALFSQLPGQAMSHQSLKLLTALEGILGLPFLFWFGYEVFSRENRRLAVIVGLVLMALVAVSYWHTSISRLALRIIYTPLITSLLLIFLMRALRDNRTGDYLKAALCLGVGLYMYQAVRMLPVVIVVTVILAAYFAVTRWRERVRYVLHLIMLAWVAFMIFLPMFHFWVEYPELFWRRTAGRFLSDALITETGPDGQLYERYATIEERIDAFSQNIPVLLNNLRNSVLMFNWKGDIAWINGLPNQPVMDPATGAFFLVGLTAWGVLLMRRRDIVFWIIPPALLIMLLPSALSIAYPNENPSLTRSIGALPLAYLIAAYPLALIVQQLWRVLPRYQWVSVIGFCSVIVLGAYSFNTYTYFVRFPQEYRFPSLPYSEAGDVLRGFAISDGAYGNAFMIAHPFWWDHRAVGIAGGRIDWPNGIVTLKDVPTFLFAAAVKPPNDPYRVFPERDLLFFYSVDATETAAQLKAWFPNGREIRYTPYQSGDDFMLYRVPALGEAGLRAFFAAYELNY